MKFESKFGIGEIVIKEVLKNKGELVHDEMLEVIAILFQPDNKTMVCCRYPKSGITHYFHECELVGDPDFNQELGAYEEEIRGL